MLILHIAMWSHLAWSATPDTSADLLRAYPKQVLRNEVVEFKPAKDMHFSPEAPQNCGEGSLVERGVRGIKCQFTKSGAAKPTLNVCDDKKTFCKPVALELTVAEKTAAVDPILTKNENLNHELKHTLLPDFKIGPPNAIVKEAAAAGKPVFVMVSTDWCPPCNEAKEHLLSSSTFKDLTKGWTKVYIDGDNLLAQDWEKVVPYRYFPTFILFNSKFEEVARYTGSIRQSEFAQWAKENEVLVKDPIASLQKRVTDRLDGAWGQRLRDLASGVGPDKRHRDQTRLLKWAIDKDERTLANRLIGTGAHPELEPEIAQYQLGLMQEDQDKNGHDDHDRRVELYRRLLAQLFTRDGWSGTLEEFCAYDAKACEPELAKIDQRLKNIADRADVSASERASQLADEYIGLVFAYEALGKNAEKKSMALKCVEAYDKLGQQSVLKMSRGSQQGVITCLEEAGDFARAEATLKPLIAAYPSEPTFLQRMARVLRKEKKPAPALGWIQKAESVAYGYNWFSVELIKADVLMDLKRNAEAKKVLDEALSQLSLEPNQDSRNQLTVSRLRAAQAKVEDLKNP